MDASEIEEIWGEVEAQDAAEAKAEAARAKLMAANEEYRPSTAAACTSHTTTFVPGPPTCTAADADYSQKQQCFRGELVHIARWTFLSFKMHAK